MDKIISSLTLDDLLIQLAEEASELAQAAKTYFYAMRAEESSPSELQDARNGLIDAIADVNVAAEAVRRKMGISCDEIAEVEDAKIEIWRRRICDASRAADRG